VYQRLICPSANQFSHACAKPLVGSILASRARWLKLRNTNRPGPHPIPIAALMSYELRIFFPQVTFPRTEWRAILTSFQRPGCLVRFEPGDPHDLCISCDLVVGESVLSTGVSPIEPGSWGRASEAANWAAMLSTTLGRSLQALWIQFAIPYHALVLLPGIVVHAEPDRIFVEIETWLEFCRERLWGPLRQKEELVESGLFTPDGSPRF
jgi:hypothetical protein